MGLFRTSRGSTKPIVGAQIDWSHRLSRGLEFDFSFLERGGGATFDLRYGRRGAFTDSPTWVNPGINFTGSAVVESSAVPDAPFFGAITLVWKGVIRTGSGFRHFAGKHEGGGGADNPFDFRTNNAGTPRLALIRANAGGFTNFEGQEVSLSTVNTIAVVTPGVIQTAPIFYVNSSATTGNGVAGSGTGPATGTASTLRIGRRADGVVQMDGVVEFCRGYSRALSADEIRWLTEEPYAHLIVPQYRRYFIPPEAEEEPETITVDKWFQPTQQPPKDRQRQQHLYPPFTVDASHLGDAERVDMDKWFRATEQPISSRNKFFRPTCNWLYPEWAYGTEPIAAPVIEVNLDQWFQPASEPRRDRARNQHLYPKRFIDSDVFINPEATAIDKWFVRSPDPLRTTRESSRRRPWMNAATNWEPSTAGGAGGAVAGNKLLALLGVG
jgi:hypothetical protein